MLSLSTAFALLSADAATAARIVQINVTNFQFQPSSPAIRYGKTIRWNFNEGTHTATDRTGMGLYDTGPRNSGTTFQYTFVAAGTYAYRCEIHPDAMNGSINVRMTVSPHTGTTATAFTFTWASTAAPLGFNYDVQVKTPGAANWSPLLTDEQNPSSSPLQLGQVGTWRFRARIQKGEGAASRYSPPLRVDITG